MVDPTMSKLPGEKMFKNYAKIPVLLLMWTAYILLFSFLQAANVPIDNEKQTIVPPETNRLCLTMIVKNEERIIERCLMSVKDIVDCISICDTGSTDNTIEIIEKFMQENKIPGKVHRHAWKNFGHNRTLSAQAAQKTLIGLGFPLLNTYLLLLDADMILRINSDFNKDHLKEDSYMVLQKSFWISYYNCRLVRASMPWECVGVTHEYWSCKVPSRSGNLETLWIDDREDGGCKAEKFERDVKLLTQGLKDEPDNARYMFYLAQSYKCLKNYDEAIRWYKARIEKEGWKEEVWYSKVMIGECYEDMGFWDHALHWYLDAYQCNPNRAETLQKIAKHYRQNSQNDLAYLFAIQGSRIPYPHGEILFVAHPVYDYLFDEEISIAAYYTSFKDEGLAAANRLILKRNVPTNTKEQAYKNLLFYVQNLKKADFQPIEIELPLIREGLQERYNPMNPSIQKTDDGYHLICRTVNYSQTGAVDFKSRDPLDGTIRTKNFLIHYNHDFKIVSQKEIIENLPKNLWKSSVEGLEDCRLFRLKNTNWFTCSTRGTHPKNIGQSLCKLEDASSATSTIKVEKFIPLQGPDENKCEKNWLPFIHDDEIYMVYSYDPFIIYKINQANGSCEPVVQYEPSHDFSHFRGSAAPIEFDDGYLMLVHEVVFNTQRYYLHRFLYLDKNFTIKKLSKPFTFLHKGIEYSCGMTLDHSGKKCIIPIGFEDQQAYLVSIDLETIRSLLEPLP